MRDRSYDMKSVNVIYSINGNEKEATYRTNNSGDYLFVGNSENKQINCECGYINKKRMQKAIRTHIVESNRYNAEISRIKYNFNF